MKSSKNPQGHHEVVGFKHRRIKVEVEEIHEIHLGPLTETEDLNELARTAALWKALDQEGRPPTARDQGRPVLPEPEQLNPQRPQHRITTLSSFFMVLLLMLFAGLGTFLLTHRTPEGSSETAKSIAGILEVGVTAALIALHVMKK